MPSRSCRIAVASIAGLTVGIAAPGYASADDRDESEFESEFEFESVNASATLTDCPTSGPAGLRCTGIVVNAGKSKDTFQRSKFVRVDVFDVVFTETSFIPTLIGSGETDVAKLSINDKLKKASASAIVDVMKCTPDPSGQPVCGDELLRTVDIKAKWSGVGQITRQHFEDEFELDGCEYEFENDFASRSATVTATVDGSAMPNSVLPQFTPSISSSEGEQKVECEVGSVPPSP
jgi:hypothetical protein